MNAKAIATAAAAVTLAASVTLYAQSRGRSRYRGNGGYESTNSQPPASAGTQSGGAASAPSSAQFSRSPRGFSSEYTPEPARSSQVLSGDFDILNHTSIFVKDRRYTNAPRTQRENDTHPQERAPEVKQPAIPVLVGVLLGDTSYIAYLEDPDSGKLWPFAPGDPLPEPYGTVKDVTLDDIEIVTPEGSTRRVPVGENLKGEAAALTSSPPAGTVSPSATSPAEKIDPNSPNLTLEQKMKLQRQQQLGGS